MTRTLGVPPITRNQVGDSHRTIGAGSAAGSRILRRAFTLLELLVVISLVAILGAMLIPAVQAARSKSGWTDTEVGKASLPFGAVAPGWFKGGLYSSSNSQSGESSTFSTHNHRLLIVWWIGAVLGMVLGMPMFLESDQTVFSDSYQDEVFGVATRSPAQNFFLGLVLAAAFPGLFLLLLTLIAWLLNFASGWFMGGFGPQSYLPFGFSFFLVLTLSMILVGGFMWIGCLASLVDDSLKSKRPIGWLGVFGIPALIAGGALFVFQTTPISLAVQAFEWTREAVRSAVTVREQDPGVTYFMVGGMVLGWGFHEWNKRFQASGATAGSKVAVTSARFFYYPMILGSQCLETALVPALLAVGLYLLTIALILVVPAIVFYVIYGLTIGSPSGFPRLVLCLFASLYLTWSQYPKLLGTFVTDKHRHAFHQLAGSLYDPRRDVFGERSVTFEKLCGLQSVGVFGLAAWLIGSLAFNRLDQGGRRLPLALLSLFAGFFAIQILAAIKKKTNHWTSRMLIQVAQAVVPAVLLIPGKDWFTKSALGAFLFDPISQLFGGQIGFNAVFVTVSGTVFWFLGRFIDAEGSEG